MLPSHTIREQASQHVFPLRRRRRYTTPIRIDILNPILWLWETFHDGFVNAVMFLWLICGWMEASVGWFFVEMNLSNWAASTVLIGNVASTLNLKVLVGISERQCCYTADIFRFE